MSLSSLDNKATKPDSSELKRVLGSSFRLWNQLVSRIGRQHAPIDEKWNYAGAKFGWSLRLIRKERIVLYLIPQSGHFLVGIVLGEKAVESARRSDVPQPIMDLIDNVKPYAEGRGIRLPVKTQEDLDTIEKLAYAKMGS